MLFMLAVILRQQPSKVQTAFVLYNVFTILFVVGIHLELAHSDTIGEALAGLCVQYIGQPGERTAGRIKSPEWIKRLEKYGINTGEGLRYADEDAAFYEEMLRLFAGQAAEKQTGPEELLDSLRGSTAGETDPEAEEKLYDQIVGVCHTLKGRREVLALGSLARASTGWSWRRASGTGCSWKNLGRRREASGRNRILRFLKFLLEKSIKVC